MNNIERIYNILQKRLPEELCFLIKIYSTCEEMLKSICNPDWTYEKILDHYKDYKPGNYLPGKYRSKINMHNPVPALNINAIAELPIICNLENMENRPEHEIAFILLHEFGHWVNSHIGEYNNEWMADEFAFRWIDALIKEGLIKYEE